IPKLTVPAPPQGDMSAVRQAAKMLVAAQAPRINCQRAARTPEGVRRVTELAELLQCPVTGNGERMHIPSRHPMAGTGYQGYPVDLVLDLEVQGGAAPPANAKSISISSLDLFIKNNIQDFQPMSQADLPIAGDAEATLPSLIEEIKRQITGDRKRVFEERGMRIAE